MVGGSKFLETRKIEKDEISDRQTVKVIYLAMNLISFDISLNKFVVSNNILTEKFVCTN